MTSSIQNKLGFIITGIAVVTGGLFGFLGLESLKILAFLSFILIVLIFFLSNFELSVIGLLVVRSSLDIFTKQQIPTIYTLGVASLTLFYIIFQLLTKKAIKTDGFWWLFVAWVLLQGLWVIILPLRGLELDTSFIFSGIRECARLFSLLMVYLLVMQLKGKLTPEQMVDKLLLSLVFPLGIALIQFVVPHTLLPELIVPRGDGMLVEGSRISGTFENSATFAKFVFLYLGLVYWKLGQVRQRLPWLALLLVLAFSLAIAKSLTAFAMVFILLLIFAFSDLDLKKILGILLIGTLVFSLFASTPYGQERISSVFDTPVLNSDVDASRAILMQEQPEEGNSFNWRILYWTKLLKTWKNYPWLGYGLGNAKFAGDGVLLAHNDYVGSLVETGIIGFTTFLVFLGFQFIRTLMIMKSAPRGSPQARFCFFLIAIQLSWFVGMGTDNIWRGTGVLFYWWSFMAIAGWDWGSAYSSDRLLNK